MNQLVEFFHLMIFYSDLITVTSVIGTFLMKT